MTNPFAIAAVTATFSQLLLRVIEEPTLAGTTVTTGPPDAARAGRSGRQLNLFLYQVTPSAAARNMDLPFRNGDGELVRRPVLALSLSYMLTAYGQGDGELDAQHLLAHAMSLVHDEGVLGREQIRDAIDAEPAVARSDLADQVELVKLCEQTISVDEVSRLWGMYQTTNYRLSVSYEASVVLIERPQPTRSALPVRSANLYVVPFRQPLIETVAPQVALPGQALRITGRNLAAGSVTLRFGSTLAAPPQVADRRIDVVLPAGLRAGVNTVQVVHELSLGTPATPHRGFESNVAAFVLAPRITTATPVSVARGQSLTLGFAPPVDRDQQVSILLGDREIAVPAREPDSAPVATLDVPVPATFPLGSHLLRLRVDGAESQLQVDENPSSPTFNQYVGPNVTVTT
jgi:Pvc16 N-terminal domain/IPT/TIG domain